MKTYSALEAQQQFPSVIKWLKSTPVAIQENDENIAIILDFKDYVEIIETQHDDALDLSDHDFNLDEL